MTVDTKALRAREPNVVGCWGAADLFSFARAERDALLDAAEERDRSMSTCDGFGCGPTRLGGELVACDLPWFWTQVVSAALTSENARLVAALRGIVEGGCPCDEHDCATCREAYRRGRAALRPYEETRDD